MRVLIRKQQGQLKIDEQKLESDSVKVLKLLDLGEAELSILLVNDKKMKELNSKYRDVDETTDVLSFPQYSTAEQKRSRAKAGNLKASALLNYGSSGLVLGDVVINLQAAKRQAPEHGFSFMEETRWLLVHGILHLIGYDHEKSRYAEIKMRKKERELLGYISGKEKNRCWQRE